MSRYGAVKVLDLGPSDPALRTPEQDARRRYAETGEESQITPLLYQAPGLKRDALLLDPASLDSFLYMYAETGDYNAACQECGLSPLLVRMRQRYDEVFGELVEYARQHMRDGMEATIYQKGVNGDNVCAFKFMEANDPRYGERKIHVEQNVKSLNVSAKADLPDRARRGIRALAREAIPEMVDER